MPVDHQSSTKLAKISTSPRSAVYSNITGSQYLLGIDRWSTSRIPLQT